MFPNFWGRKWAIISAIILIAVGLLLYSRSDKTNIADIEIIPRFIREDTLLYSKQIPVYYIYSHRKTRKNDQFTEFRIANPSFTGAELTGDTLKLYGIKDTSALSLIKINNNWYLKKKRNWYLIEEYNKIVPLRKQKKSPE